MSIKYFYYISEFKVRMLKTQFDSWGLSIPDITPKIELAGLSLGANVKFQKDENLVRETLSLVNELGKSKVVKTLGTEILGTEYYYKDESVWFSGIFSFEPLIKKNIGVYFLWKIWNNSIVLLMGSPRNILGVGDTPSPGMQAIGTPIILDNLLEFIDKASHEIETETSLEILEVDPEWLHQEIDMDGYSLRALRMQTFSKKQRDGVATILFCAKHLRKLRQQKVETLFKILEEVKLDRKIDLPELISKLARIPLEETERNELSKCKGVFIGSPIYTALA